MGRQTCKPVTILDQHNVQTTECARHSQLSSLLYGSAASQTAVAMQHCMNRTFFYRTAVRMTETMRVKPKLWGNLKQPTTGTDVAVIWHSLKKAFSMCEPGQILQLSNIVCWGTCSNGNWIHTDSKVIPITITSIIDIFLLLCEHKFDVSSEGIFPSLRRI